MKTNDELCFIIEKNLGTRKVYLSKIQEHFNLVSNAYYEQISKISIKVLSGNIAQEMASTFSRSEVSNNIQKILSGNKSKVKAAILYIEKYLDVLFEITEGDVKLDFSKEISFLKDKFRNYVNSFDMGLKFDYLLKEATTDEEQKAADKIEKDYFDLISYLKANYNIFRNAALASGIDTLSQLNFKNDTLIALKGAYADNEIIKVKTVVIGSMIEILEKYSVNAIDIFDDGSAEFILGYLEALNFVSKTAFSDSKSKESPYTPYFLSIHDNVVANLDLYFDMVAELQSVNYFELYIKTYNTDIREIKKEVFADLKKILNEHPK